jgi:hypothetical protein
MGVTVLSLTPEMTAPHAAVHYVDPSAESAGDGSESNPWASLQDAIDDGSVAVGDTVWLMSGDYGELRIASARNVDMTTIAAAQGQKPTFARVMVDDSTAPPEPDRAGISRYVSTEGPTGSPFAALLHGAHNCGEGLASLGRVGRLAALALD